MLGGVFGDITGIAPGYTISISYEPIELFTQGEYFFDAAIHAGNFFYSWSELSCAPASWFEPGRRRSDQGAREQLRHSARPAGRIQI